jgi:anthranilate 1,2-dioxygenase small subunit
MNAAAMREAAQELMDDYASLIDADRLEDWLDLFTEDASYRAMPRENVEQNLPLPLMLCTNKNMLRDRIVSLRQANEFNPHYDRHLISNVRIRLSSEGVWRLDANYAVFQTSLEGRSHLFNVGCYRDSVREEGGRLRISEKLVIMDTFAVPTLLATPL